MPDLDSVFRDRYARWQQRTRDQLGAINSLVLTYDAALIGFQIASLSGDKTIQVPSAWWFVVASILATASLVAGIGVAILRLADARATARIVRSEWKGIDKSDLAVRREQSRDIGESVWAVLYLQLGLFGASVVAEVVWVLSAYGARLRF